MSVSPPSESFGVVADVAYSVSCNFLTKKLNNAEERTRVLYNTEYESSAKNSHFGDNSLSSLVSRVETSDNDWLPLVYFDERPVLNYMR